MLRDIVGFAGAGSPLCTSELPSKQTTVWCGTHVRYVRFIIGFQQELQSQLFQALRLLNHWEVQAHTSRYFKNTSAKQMLGVCQESYMSPVDASFW